MDFKAATSEFTYDMRIAAAAEDVFPLLCPVRENEWVPGWQEAATMISSNSGVAELGAVFRTQVAGQPPETWVVTHYQPTERIAFARFGADVVTRLEIDLAEAQGTTQLTWKTSQVGTSEAGNARVEAVTQEGHTASRAALEAQLSHYLATGTMVDTERQGHHVAA